MYCGQRVILQDTQAGQEKQQIARYQQLCEVALQAKNYKDLDKYAGQILELDPTDVDAWINRAHAAFAVSSAENDHSDEARKYLEEAAG
jgi:tetratricopeptide (TPR) repeat protein